MVNDSTQKMNEGTGVYFQTHSLAKEDRSNAQHFEQWEWADYANSTLYWAELEKLMTAKISESGLNDQQCLKEFN